MNACGSCGRSDPPCGWTATTLIDVRTVGDIRWRPLCVDCAYRMRTRELLNREHALIGAD